MNKGPLGVRRMFSFWPMVSNSGGRPEGVIINARMRDGRFLIAQRSINVNSPGKTGKSRAALSIPKPIVDPLGYNTSFKIKKEEDDYSEFILKPDENSEHSYYTGAGNRSAIVINSEYTNKLPFDYPTNIGLDIDLRRPQDGILVRKLEGYEEQRLRYVTQDNYLSVIEGGL